MSDDPRTPAATALARREADEARADLLQIWAEIQRRINPQNVVREGIGAVREKAGDVAEGAAEIVRRRPMAVAGIAAVATGLIAWKPLSRLFSKKRRNPGDDQTV